MAIKRSLTILTLLTTLTLFSMSGMSQSTKVLIKTTMGDITVLLYDDTPMHKDNFIDLVKKGTYNGLLFHRVIPNFMIQSGDLDSKDAKPGQRLGSGSPGYTVPAEFKPERIHKKGALAAARQGDHVNPQKASSGSQFYIVVGKKWSLKELEHMENVGYHPKFTEEQKKIYMEQGGYPSLDYGYTVFGEVTQGLDVVEAISQVKRDGNDRPREDIKIISTRIIN